MKKKVIVVDIDGTLCSEESTFERSLAQPLPGSVDALNKFYEDGHTIILWTARGWPEYRMTEAWLQKHGYKYHQLIMGKPVASVFIDDRARRFTGWNTDYLQGL